VMVDTLFVVFVVNVWLLFRYMIFAYTTLFRSLIAAGVLEMYMGKCITIERKRLSIAEKLPESMRYLKSLYDMIEQETANRGKPVDRKSTRLNSSHDSISYAVFCLNKKKSFE